MCSVFILTNTIFYLEITELRTGEQVVPKQQEERIQEKILNCLQQENK